MKPDSPTFGAGDRPWERLTERSAQLMEQERPAMTVEMLAEIGREIPAYRGPLEGEFGEALKTGVNQALEQFVAMVRDPQTSLREEGRRVYFALGQGELTSGRSIGALLAAYRIGAQVAWRRLAEASLRSDLDQREINLLAESIFAYIDELSAESAAGYAQAQAERAGEIDARRTELIELLTRGRLGADKLALEAAAKAARWPVPREVAVMIWPTELGREPAGRLPFDSIVHGDDDNYVAIVPEPRDPARRDQLRTGFADLRSGLGSPVGVEHTPRSFAHAQAMFQLALAKTDAKLIAADEHRAELISGSDALLASQIERDRLAALDAETPGSRARLTETLLAWLRHDGSIAAAAVELHIHQQTLRYRLTRLRELLGDQLDDPDARYELEFALRAAARS